MKRSLLRIGVRLLQIVVLALLAATIASAEDKSGTAQTNAVSIDKVIEHFAAINAGMTSLQRQRSEEKLKGDWYSGTVTVFDVKSLTGDVEIEVRLPGGQLAFFIRDSKLKDKAAELKKDTKISITAKLSHFGYQSSGYIGGGSHFATFLDVRSLELAPKEPAQDKK